MSIRNLLEKRKSSRQAITANHQKRIAEEGTSQGAACLAACLADLGPPGKNPEKKKIDKKLKKLVFRYKNNGFWSKIFNFALKT